MKKSSSASRSGARSGRSSRSTPDSGGGFPLLPVVSIVVVVGLIAWLVSGSGPGSDPGAVDRPSGLSSDPTPLPSRATEIEEVAEADRPAAPVGFTPASIQLGFVRPGSVHRTTVEVTNESEAPLTLIGAKRGCSCTEVELTPGVIAPGASVPVTTVFTAGLTPTERRNTVKLQFEGHQPADLKMKADISRAIKVSPGNFYMHQGGSFDGPVTKLKGQVRLISTDGRPFRILSAGGRPPVPVSGDPASPETPSLEHRLVLDLSHLDPGTLRGPDDRVFPPFWVVETDHPEAPAVEVRLLHTAHRPPRRTPDRNWVFIENRIVVDPIESGGTTQFELPIKWTAGTRGSQVIHEVISTSPDFTAELIGLVPDGKGSKAIVRITPRSGLRGAFQGAVEFVSREHRVPLVIIGSVQDPREGEDA